MPDPALTRCSHSELTSETGAGSNSGGQDLEVAVVGFDLRHRTWLSPQQWATYTMMDPESRKYNPRSMAVNRSSFRFTVKR